MFFEKIITYEVRTFIHNPFYVIRRNWRFLAYTYTNVTVDDGQKNRSKKPVDMPAQNNKLNTVLNWDSISGDSISYLA